MANRVIKHEETIDSYPFNLPAIEIEEEELDEKKSINEMSKKELMRFIDRLRLKLEAQRILRDIQKNGNKDFDETDPPPISTNIPVSELCHHGILGMKWGVRRFQNPDGTRTAKGKARERENDAPDVKDSEEYKQSREYKSRAVKGLSNAELKSLNERMQLERQYKELTAYEKKRNESFTTGVLKKIGEKALVDAGSSLATGILKSLAVDPILKSISGEEKKK